MDVVGLQWTTVRRSLSPPNQKARIAGFLVWQTGRSQENPQVRQIASSDLDDRRSARRGEKTILRLRIHPSIVNSIAIMKNIAHRGLFGLLATEASRERLDINPPPLGGNGQKILKLAI